MTTVYQSKPRWPLPKAKSLLSPGCVRSATKPEPERHHALYPWRRISVPPKPVGSRCLVPVRNRETKLDEALPATVVERRRGWLRGEKDDTPNRTPYCFAFHGAPFTRDAAGLYMVKVDGGGVQFAHEADAMWEATP